MIHDDDDDRARLAIPTFQRAFIMSIIPYCKIRIVVSRSINI